MHKLKDLAVLFKKSICEGYMHKLSPNQIVACVIIDKVYKFVCLLAILYSTDKILNTILAAIAAFLIFGGTTRAGSVLLLGCRACLASLGLDREALADALVSPAARLVPAPLKALPRAPGSCGQPLLPPPPFAYHKGRYDTSSRPTTSHKKRGPLPPGNAELKGGSPMK